MDPRVQLRELTETPEAEAVLRALDRYRIIIAPGPGRTETIADQAAIYNAVNLVSRMFAHVEIELPADPPWLPALRPDGSLGGRLQAAVGAAGLAPAREPEQDLYLTWGQEPPGLGIGADADGWNYTFGSRHIALAQVGDGLALGGIAATSFAAGQLLGRALAPLGMPWNAVDAIVSNLLDYSNRLVPAPPADLQIGPTVMAGGGSVGSSSVYAALLCDLPGGPVAMVDPDAFGDRNRLRYPVLLDVPKQSKVEWLEILAATSRLDLRAFPTDIQGYLDDLPEPPAVPVLLSSVDTPEGRLDATDVLAQTTLTAGVDGLLLHIGSYGFGGGAGCAFCQYVNTEPALSATALLAQALGVPVEMVVAIRLRGGRLSESDAEAIVAAGRVPGGARAGERLEDVHRRSYAQASITVDSGAVVRISAPQVSVLAGLLLLTEAVKLSSGELSAFRLRGRFDIDTTGQPQGFVLPTRRDPTRRCICWSSHRRRVFQRLHQRGAPAAA